LFLFVSDVESDDSDGSRALLHVKLPPDSNISFVSDTGYIKFEFDRVFDGNTSQTALFDAVARSKVDDVLDGINSTIFAYGQTGTGMLDNKS
jgi:hypothetical protein